MEIISINIDERDKIVHKWFDKFDKNILYKYNKGRFIYCCQNVDTSHNIHSELKKYLYNYIIDGKLMFPYRIYTNNADRWRLLITNSSTYMFDLRKIFEEENAEYFLF